MRKIFLSKTAPESLPSAEEAFLKMMEARVAFGGIPTPHLRGEDKTFIEATKVFVDAYLQSTEVVPEVEEAVKILSRMPNLSFTGIPYCVAGEINVAFHRLKWNAVEMAMHAKRGTSVPAATQLVI
jgi:hypothetical protein